MVFPQKARTLLSVGHTPPSSRTVLHSGCVTATVWTVPPQFHDHATRNYHARSYSSQQRQERKSPHKPSAIYAFSAQPLTPHKRHLFKNYQFSQRITRVVLLSITTIFLYLINIYFLFAIPELYSLPHYNHMTCWRLSTHLTMPLHPQSHAPINSQKSYQSPGSDGIQTELFNYLIMGSKKY